MASGSTSRDDPDAAKTSSQASAPVIMTNSMTGSQGHSMEREKVMHGWSPLRRRIAIFMEWHIYDIIMGALTLVNAGLIVVETDRRAAGEDEAPGLVALGMFFLITYTIDVTVRLWVFRMHFFQNRYNILDFCIVASDIIGGLLVLIIGEGPSLSLFRIFRICRLLRFVHVLVLFRELQMMLSGFVSAMKAIFWASFMLFIMVTLWSIIAVETLHPINQRLAAAGYYEGCERCPRAFASVLQSNLTFMQQIIAGDSWGMVSVPIIEEAPMTALLFFAVLITINLGLLNLVLTVIVDAASEAREADESRKLQEKHLQFESAKKELVSLCQELDGDMSGELTLDELNDGMECNLRFAQTMAVLDVSIEDMGIIFRMLDQDDSGSVSYTEFVEQLHRLKTQDSNTSFIFVKGYLHDIRIRLAEQVHILKDDIGGATKKMLEAMQALVYGDISSEEQTEILPVTVKVEQATGLRNADWCGKSDPYCVVEVLNKPELKFQTPVLNNTLDPLWEFEKTLEGFVRGDSLVFTIYDQDPLKADDLLGRAVLSADQLIDCKSNFHGKLGIENDGTTQGSLTVKVVDPNQQAPAHKTEGNGQSRNGQAGNGNGDGNGCSSDDGPRFISLSGLADEFSKLSGRLDEDFQMLLEEVMGNKQLLLKPPPAPIAPPPLDEVKQPQKKVPRPPELPICCNVNRGNEPKTRVVAPPRPAR